MKLTPRKSALRIDTKHPDALSRVFGNACVVREFARTSHVYVPFNMQSIRILANIGLDMDDWAVIRHTYSYPKVEGVYDLYWWQIKTAAFMTLNKRAFVLNEPRTGKTAAALVATDFLMKSGEINKCLIITPKACTNVVWAKEMRGLLPLRSPAELTKDKKTRIKQLRNPQYTDYFIINPDALMLDYVITRIQAMVDDGTINAIILDESTEYGNYQTQRWAALASISSKVDFFWQMTGTPGDPMVVHGQALLKDPQNEMLVNKHLWESATMRVVNSFQVMGRGGRKKTVNRMVPSDQADRYVEKVLHPAIRIKKREVIKDMPAEVKIPRLIRLSAQQDSLYRTLRDDKAVRVQGHELIPANAAVLAMKLSQISTGTVIIDSESGEYIKVPMPDKLAFLDYLINETPHKAIIYANYRATIEVLEDYVTNTMKRSCAVIHGGTSSTERNATFTAFMDSEDPHVLIAHPLTVSYGVELARADKLIWFGVPRISAEKYQQANERLYSSKQKSESPAIYQISSTADETALFKALDAGVDWNEAVADMFKDAAFLEAA